jgi:hypothetical protein
MGILGRMGIERGLYGQLGLVRRIWIERGLLGWLGLVRRMAAVFTRSRLFQPALPWPFQRRPFLGFERRLLMGFERRICLLVGIVGRLFRRLGLLQLRFRRWLGLFH